MCKPGDSRQGLGPQQPRLPAPSRQRQTAEELRSDTLTRAPHATADFGVWFPRPCGILVRMCPTERFNRNAGLQGAGGEVGAR